MKCEVIRDLIPLFDEKLCSPESADLVAEHLENCAECRAILENLPKSDIPKAELSEIKPFVKIKRKLRERIAAVITLGVVLLAVLVPVGYLTVNQIFHCGGTDFEDLIYRHEARQFGEMLAEGRMDEFAELLNDKLRYNTSDGSSSIGHKEFYLEKLKAAYEKVEKYNPRVGKINSVTYADRGHSYKFQDFYLYFYDSDGSLRYEAMIGKGINESSDAHGFMIMIPVEYSKLYSYDPEKNNYENYCDMADYSPEDLREICGFMNTLYLADGGDFGIQIIEKFLHKPTSAPVSEEGIDTIAHFIAARFDVFDYKAVYKGVADFKKSNYTLEATVGFKQWDESRNMLFCPVTLIGSDRGHEVTVTIRLYIDEYGFHSPRPEDIKGADGGSDLEKKLAGIFG